MVIEISKSKTNKEKPKSLSQRSKDPCKSRMEGRNYTSGSYSVISRRKKKEKQ